MAHQSSTALEQGASGVTNCSSPPNFDSAGRAGRGEAFAISPLSRETAALTLLSYCYRFVTNFAFLALVYFTLNFVTKYEERTIIAALVLAYTAMRIASALRQFHFFSRIERLEAEARA